MNASIFGTITQTTVKKTKMIKDLLCLKYVIQQKHRRKQQCHYSKFMIIFRIKDIMFTQLMEMILKFAVQMGTGRMLRLHIQIGMEICILQHIMEINNVDQCIATYLRIA